MLQEVYDPYRDQRIISLAKKAAENAAKNADVAPQLLMADILFVLVDAVKAGELIFPQHKKGETWDQVWNRFEEEGHIDISEVVTEAELISKANGPRVTLEELEANIATYDVFNANEAMEALGHPTNESLKLLTIALVTTKNGFTVIGHSACAWPANFDFDIGSRLALKDAKDKLWALMGYHLKQQLYNNAQPPYPPSSEAGEAPTDEAGPTSVSEGVAEANTTWEERLRKEEAELKERLDKLDAFIKTDLFTSLPDRDQRLMVEQRAAMSSYHTILVCRQIGIA